MKIRLNPIMKKEFKAASRSMNMAWSLTAYEMILAFIFITTVWFLGEKYGDKYQGFYRDIPMLFPLIGIAQIVMTVIVVPVMTASSISGEKERQTFDIMLTTALTPMEIISGKVFSAVAEIMLYVTAGIPIMSLAFVQGGYSWWTLFLFLAVDFILATFIGSVGVFCSSFGTKSVTSIVRTIGLVVALCFATCLPMIVMLGVTRLHRAYDSMLFLLLNPLIFLEEFFGLTLYGESLFSSNRYYYNGGFFTQLLSHGPLWCIFSGIALLGFSWLFMYLAARKIDPLAGGVLKTGRKMRNVKRRNGK